MKFRTFTFAVSSVFLFFVLADGPRAMAQSPGGGKASRKMGSAGMARMGASPRNHSAANLSGFQKATSPLQIQPKLSKQTYKNLNGTVGRIDALRHSGLSNSLPSVASKLATAPGVLNPKHSKSPLSKFVPEVPKVNSVASGPAALKHAVSHSPFKSGFLAGVHFAPNHCHQPLSHRLWCHYHPAVCHWWWNFCPTLHRCVPSHFDYWNCLYISCPGVVNGVISPSSLDWYLGLSGMLLPGSGLGIDAVAAGSPADQAGLKPGMVITEINGLAMTEEAALQTALANSQGVLRMTVVSAADQPAQQIVIAMQLITKVNF